MIDPDKLRALDEHGICVCPFCDKPLTYSTGRFNKVGRCETEDCWLCERKAAIPVDEPRQIAQFNNRAAILAMAEREKRMREALEQIAGGKMAGWKSGEVAQQALGKDQA